MEAGPFGLHLTKSPSVVDVVQKILPPSGCVSCSTSFGCSESGSRHGLNPLASWCSSNKTEPTKFSASLLRIGNWEFVSRNEIDLVAKCYFAKHKLIWEVLGYRLKSKIEFHWSGIIVIKAKCCKGGHGTLDIVRLILSRRSRRCGKQHQTLQMVNQEYIDKIMEVWHTRYPLLIVRTGLLPLWRTRPLKKGGICFNVPDAVKQVF
ncbi:uncharacterized protein LOC103977342 isoform X2 [Musa acuminata AAA Group]|uniref:uncharacterized protein LOC103977342 isoform X2 n=1 Tax=Musa acuminata AAA Group TaxID=214697 RepID=UPI0031CFBBC5